MSKQLTVFLEHVAKETTNPQLADTFYTLEDPFSFISYAIFALLQRSSSHSW